MSFRGRGRGRGGGRASRYDQHVKHQPYVLFPEEVCLPTLPEPPKDQEMELITSKVKLEYFWKGSCYHLEEAGLKSKKNDVEIERYSDRFKLNKQTKREALSSYLKLAPSNFPAELIQGSRRHQQDPKKLRWDRDTDAKMLETWEKLEENSKGNKSDDKEKKDEDEEGEEVEEEVEEDSEDDYNQNEYFDDDEDDLNMEEEEFEDAYE